MMNVTIRIGDTVENYSSDKCEIVVSYKKSTCTNYLHRKPKSKGSRPNQKNDDLIKIHDKNFYKEEK